MIEEEKCFKDKNNICDAVNLSDADERCICLIIWRLTAKELRIAPDQLNPEMTSREASRMVYPPFVGIDILGELEHEIRTIFHVDIDFDGAEIPTCAASGLFSGRKDRSEKLKDWVLKMTKLTSALISEARNAHRKE